MPDLPEEVGLPSESSSGAELADVVLISTIDWAAFAESLLNHPRENGRTYSAFCAGRYQYPNDEVRHCPSCPSSRARGLTLNRWFQARERQIR